MVTRDGVVDAVHPGQGPHAVERRRRRLLAAELGLGRQQQARRAPVVPAHLVFGHPQLEVALGRQGPAHPGQLAQLGHGGVEQALLGQTLGPAQALLGRGAVAGGGGRGRRRRQLARPGQGLGRQRVGGELDVQGSEGAGGPFSILPLVLLLQHQCHPVARHRHVRTDVAHGGGGVGPGARQPLAGLLALGAAAQQLPVADDGFFPIALGPQAVGHPVGGQRLQARALLALQLGEQRPGTGGVAGEELALAGEVEDVVLHAGQARGQALQQLGGAGVVARAERDVSLAQLGQRRVGLRQRPGLRLRLRVRQCGQRQQRRQHRHDRQQAAEIRTKRHRKEINLAGATARVPGRCFCLSAGGQVR